MTLDRLVSWTLGDDGAFSDPPEQRVELWCKVLDTRLSPDRLPPRDYIGKAVAERDQGHDVELLMRQDSRVNGAAICWLDGVAHQVSDVRSDGTRGGYMTVTVSRTTVLPLVETDPAQPADARTERALWP